jgi:hypothetical protein
LLKPVYIYPAFPLSIYPNRDSSNYTARYNIQVQDVIHWSRDIKDILILSKGLVAVRFLSVETPIDILADSAAELSWAEFVMYLIGAKSVKFLIWNALSCPPVPKSEQRDSFQGFLPCY